MADYKYTPADFKSDQEVRWCPGCGDHAILNAVQRALPEIADQTDTPHNLFTFISGIGCSSRFIYYMKTFGFHSVHGRANAIATGVKTANPRLTFGLPRATATRWPSAATTSSTRSAATSTSTRSCSTTRSTV